MTPSDLDEAAALLRKAGYLVAKIPPCGKGGRDHGKQKHKQAHPEWFEPKGEQA
jgi:hypothetical protein